MPKKSIDVAKFCESAIFIDSVNEIKIKDFDFSCVFNKDLKKKDKIDLYKRFENLEKLLYCFFLLKTFHVEYGVEFRPELKKYKH